MIERLRHVIENGVKHLHTRKSHGSPQHAISDNEPYFFTFGLHAVHGFLKTFFQASIDIFASISSNLT
jgi:hypothetical protein